MRLAITIAGIALLTAAIWQTIDDRSSPLECSPWPRWLLRLSETGFD